MANTLKEFSVHGPFKVPLEPNKHGKMVARDLDDFWSEVGELRHSRGAYVFGIRAGKGITPVYIGKAAKQSFEYEAFGNHQRVNHYNPTLLDYKRGNPVIFFVVHPSDRGAVNKTLIDEIESFLIDVASAKNPDLSNIRKKPVHKWRIHGVVRSGAGKSSQSAEDFKKAVGLLAEGR